MRINMSSRELRAALASFLAAGSALAALWKHADKLVQLVAYHAFTGTAAELADELEHPKYEHGRAVRLAREMFDAGMGIVAIIDDELQDPGVAGELREARSAALVFMETVAKCLGPVAGLGAREPVRSSA